MAKLKMVCPHCKGENVKVDAWAAWDADKQQWELVDTFDAAYCDDCDHEMSYVERIKVPE